MLGQSISCASPVLRIAVCSSSRSRLPLSKLAESSYPAPLRPSQFPIGRRYRSTFRQQFREQLHRSPILFPIAIGIIGLASSICVLYVPWYYRNVILKPYHNFPEPVAKKLRRALFYSRGQWLDMHEANKYFRQALVLANELGMDPFSDEIMGVKYAIAALFEEAGYYSLAVDVLETMRHDCQRWVNEFSEQHWNDGNRNRIKKNMVQINLKLGQLYDTRYVNEPEHAEKRLVEAVESVLTEKKRREEEGLRTGEGPWMTDDEIGSTLEGGQGKLPCDSTLSNGSSSGTALGSHYEQFDSHYLATPLFVKALDFCSPNSCHSVVLMNNVSTCLVQQLTPSSTNAIAMSSTSPDFPVTAPAPRALLIDQARQWALKALARANLIAKPERTEECDLGCAVATHNLGEFLEMEGKVNEAREKYKDSLKLAKKLSFSEGVANATAGLDRLEKRQMA